MAHTRGPAKPAWIRKRITADPVAARTDRCIHELGLNTVCERARCPNRNECLCRGTATFLILGSVCTRSCRFCGISGGTPLPPDPGEPARLAEAVSRMGLRHCVITSVTRDDLADRGAGQFASCIRAVHERVPGVTLEVLVPDFGGCGELVDRVAACGVDVFNHNVETVPSLYARVRPGADFERSVRVLARARRACPGTAVKSGIMVGLGERPDEMRAVFGRLREAGCDLLTIGQYLRPDRTAIEVAAYIDGEQFARYREQALGMGFSDVQSGPFVRSSFMADHMLERSRNSVKSAIKA